MKTNSLLLLFIFAFLPQLILANETKPFGNPVSLEGTIQGYNCITSGKTCPIGKEDPLIETESLQHELLSFEI